MTFCKDCGNLVQVPGRRWCDKWKMYLCATQGCSCGEQKKAQEIIDMEIYDVEEIHPNCTVQIWKNSATGKTSIGWWENPSEE